MKIIRNLFILGLYNYVIMIGVLFAADFVNAKKEAEKPIPVAADQVIPINSPTPTKAAATVSNIKKVITGTPYPTKAQTAAPTSAPTTQSTPQPTPTTDPLAGKCIIYISGQRYDMTDFRTLHSGGDIFQCGTDMTAIFNGQHPGSYLDRIAKYKI